MRFTLAKNIFILTVIAHSILTFVFFCLVVNRISCFIMWYNCCFPNTWNRFIFYIFILQFTYCIDKSLIWWKYFNILGCISSGPILLLTSNLYTISFISVALMTSPFMIFRILHVTTFLLWIKLPKRMKRLTKSCIYIHQLFQRMCFLINLIYLLFFLLFDLTYI